MAKEKKEKKEKKEIKEKKLDTVEEEKEDTYESRLIGLSPIAHPLASKKLCKKVYKTIKQATKNKSVKRGVKEVVKGLRKGVKGIVIIAGDINPIDVITHLPVLCEENNVSYIYVPSKEDLGSAGSTKRPTSCLMMTDKEIYGEIEDEIAPLNSKLITTV